MPRKLALNILTIAIGWWATWRPEKTLSVVLDKFINQSPLFQYSSFRSKRKTIFKQKQFTRHKIETTLYILEIFNKKNYNRRRENWLWIFWQQKSVNEQYGSLNRPSV